MEELFSGLAGAVEGTPLIALSAAFIWGIFSIILSPCHLSSIPLIIAFIDKRGQVSAGRAFVISSLFSLGILITIAAIGALTAVAGGMIGDIGPYANYFVVIIFFLIGLHLLDVIPLPFSGINNVEFKKKGFFAAFILGLVFGIALGPCTFAFMAPVLAVSFKTSTISPFYGYILLFAYGVGHCAVIVSAGTSTRLVQRILDWNEQSKGSVILRRICGLLVILGGLYLLYIT